MHDPDTSLVSFLSRTGVELCGVADCAAYRRSFPNAPFPEPGSSALGSPLAREPEGRGGRQPDWPRAIVLAWPLSRGVLGTIASEPNPIYFHHYRQVNYQLDTLAVELATAIERAGFLALPIAASQTLDSEDRTAHLSHRHMGLLADLGWRGKNNLLVNARWGCAFRLVSVLTDAPLEDGCRPPRPAKPGTPPFYGRGEGCGDCTACADACPAGAIGKTPEAFDLERCAAKLSEFRKMPRMGQRICGVCQRACAEAGPRC